MGGQGDPIAEGFQLWVVSQDLRERKGHPAEDHGL